MILTAQQVKEKLKVGDVALRRLAEDNTLIPVNTRTPGAKKFFARYNSADVNRLLETWRANGNGPRPRRTPAPEPPPAVSPTPPAGSAIGILQRIEQKLDTLIALWC